MSVSRDLQYDNDVAVSDDAGSAGAGWWQLLAILFLVVAALLWARWATLDEVTTAMGRVVPAAQTQVVQSLEGGIVRELLVREGGTVEAGQVILRIDDTGFSSRLGELNQRRASLRAEVQRLEAEATAASEVRFDEKLEADAPTAVAAEKAAFVARRNRLDTDIALLEQQLLQRQQEQAELQARHAKLTSMISLTRKELELNRQLQQRGNAPAVDVMRLERQLAELHGDLDIARSSLPRIQAAVEEARTRSAGSRTVFAAQVRERLAQVQSEISVIDESIMAAQDRVRRAAVRSPVRGVINRLAVTTIGAVVQPGQPLADIVPLDDALLIETRVKPKDIAFVTPGQSAVVKFTAYDYLIYGSLKGTVERVSADSLRDERGEPYYQVIVRTHMTHLGNERGRFAVIPGLIGTVDIQTGQKSVLDYVAAPILRARHEAMRER